MYWIGKSYKVTYKCSLELDEPELVDIDKVCYEISKGFDCDCEYDEGELRITKTASGTYYEGDYWNPPEYDDDLCFDVDDVALYLKTHKIEFSNKWDDYSYSFDCDNYF